VGKVKSIVDKIDDVTVLPNGQVRHNLLRVARRNKDYRKEQRRFKVQIKQGLRKVKNIKYF
jgi:peptide-methionine (R)-S-oxide reductase